MENSSEQLAVYWRLTAVNRGWKYVRWFVAAVLLFAAGLKAHQLATVPSLGEGFLHARWFNIFVVEFELFFGVWLIFGLLPRLTWLVTTALFSVFTLVSCYKAISGEASCGCFGAVTVNPWMTMVFDLGVVGLLGIFRPANAGFRFQNVIDEFLLTDFRLRKLLWVVLVWFVIAAPITYAMIAVGRTDLGDLGVEFAGLDGQKTFLLTPGKWIGKEFPLLPYIEQSKAIERLKDEAWTVVFFHHDCEKCKQILANFAERKIPHVFCIEIPPYGNRPQGFEYAKLSETRKWFVDTPVILKLDNLIVKEIVEQ